MKTTNQKTERSIIYAMATGPGSNHIDVSHFYPTLKKFFEEMKKTNLIEKYAILTMEEDEEEIVGRRGLSGTFKGDLSFLLLGYDNLGKKVFGILKNYEFTTGSESGNSDDYGAGYNDGSVFDCACWYDIGTCMGKAITNDKNLLKIEKNLSKKGFTKSLEYEATYHSRGDNPEITVKFTKLKDF